MTWNNQKSYIPALNYGRLGLEVGLKLLTYQAYEFASLIKPVLLLENSVGHGT